MIRGIQTGFWLPQYAQLPTWNFVGTRFDYQSSVEAAAQNILASRAAGFTDAILLIQDPADIPRLRALIPPPLGISGLNEPDILVGGFFGLFQRPRTSVAQSAAWIDRSVPLCDAAGYTPYTPPISNLHTTGLNYLGQLWPLVKKYSSLRVDIHRYAPSNDATAPQVGSRSRQEEIAKLKAIIGDRPWIVSEFGYAAPPNSEDQQADLWRQEFAFWDTTDVQCVIAYQVPRSTSDTYGVYDNGRWLPAARIFETPIVVTPPQPESPVEIVIPPSMVKIKDVALRTLLNFRFGGCSQGFEPRPLNFQGGDETASVWRRPDGWLAVLSPNGREWLSPQPNGTLEGRPANKEPEGWECFSEDSERLTERPKDGLARPLMQFGLTDPLPIAAHPVERLHLNGNGLFDAAGQRMFLRGADAFAAYEIFLRFGPEPLRAPFTELQHRYGVTCLRWWLQSLNLQANEFNRPPFDPATFPNFFSALPDFLGFVKGFGFWSYVDLFPDVALMHDDLGWQQGFYDQVRAILEPEPGVFGLVFQNEAAAHSFNKLKPGFDPKSPSIPWVGTSYSDADPAYSSGSYPADDLGGGPMGDLHPTRHYPAHILDCCPVNNIYWKSNKAVIIGEPDRYGWGGNLTRRDAELSAAATCAGAIMSVFHSKRGMRCEVFDSETANCADGWFGAL